MSPFCALLLQHWGWRGERHLEFAICRWLPSWLPDFQERLVQQSSACNTISHPELVTGTEGHAGVCLLGYSEVMQAMAEGGRKVTVVRKGKPSGDELSVTELCFSLCRRAHPCRPALCEHQSCFPLMSLVGPGLAARGRIQA